MKIKTGVVSRVIKLDGIGVERIRMFPFLPPLLMTQSLCSAYDLVKTRLLELEAEAER